jgi:hypothetical protein
MLPLVCNDAIALLFMFDLTVCAGARARVCVRVLAPERGALARVPPAPTGGSRVAQRKITLSNIKNWFKQARVLNKTAVPFLVGTKFDQFIRIPVPQRQQMVKDVSSKEARNPARSARACIDSSLPHTHANAGTKVCAGHEGGSLLTPRSARPFLMCARSVAGSPDLLLGIGVHQRAENLQDCAEHRTLPRATARAWAYALTRGARARAQVFELPCNVQKITGDNEPIIEY